MPINYYYEMTGIITDTKIITKMLRKYFPELERLIDEEYMTIKNFINKWIITIFTNDFQKGLGYIIWDFLLLQGNIVLFKGIFTIFSILKKNLLAQSKKEDTLYPIFVNTLNIDPKNKKILFGLAMKNYDGLDEKRINLKRNILNPKVFDNIIKLNKNSYNRKMKMKNFINDKCDQNWPICLGNDKIRTNPINKLNYIVFKIPNNPVYYNNYFFDEINHDNHEKNNDNINNILDNKEYKNKVDTCNDLYNIITEREHHRCCSIINNEMKYII